MKLNILQIKYGPIIFYPNLFQTQKGQPRVTIIIPIRRISESESLFSRGSRKCFGGSSGADGGQCYQEKVIFNVFIFLSGALGGSLESNRGQFHQEKIMSTASIFL